MPKSGILVPIDSYFPAAVLERIRDADEEKDKEKSWPEMIWQPR